MSNHVEKAPGVIWQFTGPSLCTTLSKAPLPSITGLFPHFSYLMTCYDKRMGWKWHCADVKRIQEALPLQLLPSCNVSTITCKAEFRLLKFRGQVKEKQDVLFARHMSETILGLQAQLHCQMECWYMSYSKWDQQNNHSVEPKKNCQSTESWANKWLLF